MENYLVKDLMVPLSEYAVVPVGSSLLDAVLALEHAQEEFDHSKYKHRAVLVVDEKNVVIGQLNHLDALSALEPGHDEDYETDELRLFGFSAEYVRDLHQQKRKRAVSSLDNFCELVDVVRVEDLMRLTMEKEYIDCEASFAVAIHQFVSEKLYSLLVRQAGVVIGVLRLADVFAAVYHTMVQCTDLRESS